MIYTSLAAAAAFCVGHGYFEDEALLSSAATPENLQPLRVLLPQLREDAAAGAATAKPCVHTSHNSDKTLTSVVSISTHAADNVAAARADEQLPCTEEVNEILQSCRHSSASADLTKTAGRCGSRSPSSDDETGAPQSDYEPLTVASSITERQMSRAELQHVSLGRKELITVSEKLQGEPVHAEEAFKAAAALVATGGEATHQMPVLLPQSLSTSRSTVETLIELATVAAGSPVVMPAASPNPHSPAPPTGGALPAAAAASLRAASPTAVPGSATTAATAALSAIPSSPATLVGAAALSVSDANAALPSGGAAPGVHAQLVGLGQSPTLAASVIPPAAPAPCAGGGGALGRGEDSHTPPAVGAAASPTATSSSNAGTPAASAPARTEKFVDVLSSLRQAVACLSRVSSRRMSDYLRYTVAPAYDDAAACTWEGLLIGSAPTPSPLACTSTAVLTGAPGAGAAARITSVAFSGRTPASEAVADRGLLPPLQARSRSFLSSACNHQAATGNGGDGPQWPLPACPPASWRDSSESNEDETRPGMQKPSHEVTSVPQCSCCAAVNVGSSLAPLTVTTAATQGCRRMPGSHCLQQRTRLLAYQFGVEALRDACATYIQAAARGWLTRMRVEKGRCMRTEQQQQSLYGLYRATAAGAAIPRIAVQQHRFSALSVPTGHYSSSRKLQHTHVAPGTDMPAAAAACAPSDICRSSSCGGSMPNHPACKSSRVTFPCSNRSTMACRPRSSSSSWHPTDCRTGGCGSNCCRAACWRRGDTGLTGCYSQALRCPQSSTTTTHAYRSSSGSRPVLQADSCHFLQLSSARPSPRMLGYGSVCGSYHVSGHASAPAASPTPRR